MTFAMQNVRANASFRRHMEVEWTMRPASSAAPGDLTIRPMSDCGTLINNSLRVFDASTRQADSALRTRQGPNLS